TPPPQLGYGGSADAARHCGAIDFDAHGTSRNPIWPGGKKTTSFEVGTLGGFPRPPAMVRGEPSSPASHASSRIRGDGACRRRRADLPDRVHGVREDHGGSPAGRAAGLVV